MKSHFNICLLLLFLILFSVSDIALIDFKFHAGWYFFMFFNVAATSFTVLVFALTFMHLNALLSHFSFRSLYSCATVLTVMSPYAFRIIGLFSHVNFLSASKLDCCCGPTTTARSTFSLIC